MVPVVYLPIEIKHRELPSRLLIAHHLLRAGYAVLIGNQWSLDTNQRALPAGAYFFKSVNKIQGRSMEKARAVGHLAVANDEEVLGAIDHNGFMAGFSDLAAANCDIFFAQSPAHRSVIEGHFPALAGKVRDVGNPRIDLMSAGYRALFDASSDPRVESCKPYVLFNTNYGTINSIWAGKRDQFELAKLAGAFDGPDSAQKVAEYTAMVEWERRNHEAMVALLTWFAQNVTGINIVVRPHPGEKPGYWETALAGVPHARVIPRSDPHPWILGAELIVHTGCTTGLEAVLLGKPSINLLPTDHPTYDRLVTHVNPTFRTWEEAAQAIKAFLVNRTGPIADGATSAAAAMSQHLPSHRSNDAAEVISNLIVSGLQARGAHAIPPGTIFDLKFREPFQKIKRSEITKDKFSATESEIGDGLDKIAEIRGITPGFRLSTLDESVFLLSPA